MKNAPLLGLVALATVGCKDNLDDTHAPTGSGTDTGSTIVLTEADCGLTLNDPIRRVDWFPGATTQNEGTLLSSGLSLQIDDTASLIEAVCQGVNPPHPEWPTSIFPDTYNIGDEISADCGMTWYVDELTWPGSEMNLTGGVVHYTASERVGSCEDTMQSMTNFHTFGDEHGWGDLGYNFVLCEEDGVVDVYQGRWERITTDNPWLNLVQTEGAHASGYNDTHFGGALVLGVNPDDLSELEVESMKQVYARLAIELDSAGSGFDPGEIAGHDHFGATECPGPLGEHVDAIRERAIQCVGEFSD